MRKKQGFHGAYTTSSPQSQRLTRVLRYVLQRVDGLQLATVDAPTYTVDDEKGAMSNLSEGKSIAMDRIVGARGFDVPVLPRAL